MNKLYIAAQYLWAARYMSLFIDFKENLNFPANLLFKLTACRRMNLTEKTPRPGFSDVLRV